MNNKEIAGSLVKLGRLLEYKGENWFKVNAYYRAAKAIQEFPDEVATLAQQQRLLEIPGIGTAIASKITGLLATGELQKYGHEKKGLPEDILSLLALSKVNPTALRKLVARYQTTTLTTLSKLAESNDLGGGLSPTELSDAIKMIMKKRGPDEK